MKVVCMTHQGLVRINNEDSVAVHPEGQWLVLADGMGGLLAGEEASRVAVDTACQMLEQNADAAPADIVLAAHEAVYTRAKKKNYVGKMGTTLVVWLWNDGAPTFGHIGDSRVYGWTDGELQQLSHDHTLAQRMIDEGSFPKEREREAPNRNVLTQALGMPGNLNPDTGTSNVSGRVLLCSDGLSDLVEDNHIAELVAVEDLEEAANSLVKAALDKGGRDNVSVALVDLDSAS